MTADRESCAQGEWRPGRLWSLWEIMHELKSGEFLKAYQQASVFHQMVAGVPKGQGMALPVEDVQVHMEAYEFLADQLVALGLGASSQPLKRAVDVLSQGKAKIQAERELLLFDAGQTMKLGNHLTQATERIADDFRAQAVLVLKPEEAELYASSRDAFGAKVNDTFGIGEEIEHAGKCLALGEGTACVFHLMRAMESVVSQLGDKLDVTIIDKDNVSLTWGKILANMKAPIEKMPKGNLRDLWSEAHALLYHVKEAWRNDTMHPKQTYTYAQAKEVFDATKAFMNRLVALI